MLSARVPTHATTLSLHYPLPTFSLLLPNVPLFSSRRIQKSRGCQVEKTEPVVVDHGRQGRGCWWRRGAAVCCNSLLGRSRAAISRREQRGGPPKPGSR